MFISDKLVYVGLQKTGSTHIGKLLSRTVHGKLKGKHNKPKRALIESSHKFISSIRNPWAWYVSLWTYGCDGHGAVRERLAESKNAAMWEQCYTDSSDPGLFRKWLGMVYAPEIRRNLGEGYGKSSVQKMAGFYTFRYLKLCCRNANILNSDQLQSINDLLIFERNNCYITRWIRNESLERDFLDIVTSSGEPLTNGYKQAVLSTKKTNTSKRKYSPEVYYDKNTAQAVEENEAIIIQKFGYAFPGADNATA